MSVKQIKEKIAKMPEWMAKCEDWKKNIAESGEGKCGSLGGMMGMAKEHMKTTHGVVFYQYKYLNTFTPTQMTIPLPAPTLY